MTTAQAYGMENIRSRPDRESVSHKCERSFRPPWFLRNGHVQTLAGMYLYGSRSASQRGLTVQRTSGRVQLSDGDRLVFQDECPAGWKPGDRVALFLHGLGGSHASPHMTRTATRFREQQIRTVRLDWRGCGAGGGLARAPYHSGRSNDLEETLQHLQELFPGSPFTVVGFSLGGNILLKWLGEACAETNSPVGVDRAIAVCPPIDLSLTVDSLTKGWGRLYGDYFCRSILREVAYRRRRHPDTLIPDGWGKRLPKTIYEFDDTFTAPICGFQSAQDYYSKSSSGQRLSSITVPTLIVAAQDDPLIPFEQFKTATFSASTTLTAPRHGGHLGFCHWGGHAWLDQRIVEWGTHTAESA